MLEVHRHPSKWPERQGWTHELPSTMRKMQPCTRTGVFQIVRVPVGILDFSKLCGISTAGF